MSESESASAPAGAPESPSVSEQKELHVDTTVEGSGDVEDTAASSDMSGSEAASSHPQRPPSTSDSAGGDSASTGGAATATSSGGALRSSHTTKVIYHVDEQKTPYLLKVPGQAGEITLRDFKAALNRPGSSFKYYFNSVDDDFGVVKEEVDEDTTSLPAHKGRIVAYLVTNDSQSDNAQSDRVSTAGAGSLSDISVVQSKRDRNSSSGYSSRSRRARDGSTGKETMDSSGEGVLSPSPGLGRSSGEDDDRRRHRSSHQGHGRQYRQSGRSSRYGSGVEGDITTDASVTDASSIITASEFGASSYFESDSASRLSGVDAVSMRQMRKRYKRKKQRRLPRYSSCSSFTESTVDSLNIITVCLDMEPINFLGISIVGQSNSGGDGGIFVGSVMKGGAVDADGRIGPGDMILQVNEYNLEDMDNDGAVRVLRDVVQKPGRITITVAKCFDPTATADFHGIDPRADAVQPIDPSAWVQHTEAIRALYGSYTSPTMSTITSGSSSLNSSLPEAERPILPEGAIRLSSETPIEEVARQMAAPSSGLDVRDRMWLKIKIPRSFIGSDVVDWIYSHLDGFTERRQARKYASNMLKAGFFKHTVNKITFSEQCYYIFNKDLTTEFAHLRVKDGDTDTLQTLPEHGELAYRPAGYGMGGPRAFPHQHYDPFMDAQTLMSVSMHRTRSSGSGSPSGNSPYASTVGPSPPGSANMSLQRHSSSGSNHSPRSGPRSPTASISSRISRASTLSAGSYNIGAGRRVLDGMGRPLQSPTEDPIATDRLQKLSSKLKRGSITSLNTLSSIQSGVRGIPMGNSRAVDTASLYSVASKAMYDSVSMCSARSRKLDHLPVDVATSQHSFKNAMDNTCDKYFVDVM